MSLSPLILLEQWLFCCFKTFPTVLVVSSNGSDMTDFLTDDKLHKMQNTDGRLIVTAEVTKNKIAKTSKIICLNLFYLF